MPKTFGVGTVLARLKHLSSVRTLLSVIALAGSLLLTGCQSATPNPVAVPASTVPAPVKPAPVGCTKPTPTTAKGFASMFAALPVSEWGAADVSISVPLSDGRSVWLYGDTFSAGRFVHSTAITQDKGCLHVSNGGAQLLPNDDANHIYWIHDATAISDRHISVIAEKITLTGTCPWCFKPSATYRKATVTVDAKGDVTFNRWEAGTLTAAEVKPQVMDFKVVGPHHFTYSRHTHPQFKLSSGKVLVTVCQNWDDGKLHPMNDYRPIFSEESR